MSNEYQTRMSKLHALRMRTAFLTPGITLGVFMLALMAMSRGRDADELNTLSKILIALGLMVFGAGVGRIAHISWQIISLRRQRREIIAGRCPRCGYNMWSTGMVVCPECGFKSLAREEIHVLEDETSPKL